MDPNSSSVSHLFCFFITLIFKVSLSCSRFSLHVMPKVSSQHTYVRKILFMTKKKYFHAWKDVKPVPSAGKIGSVTKPGNHTPGAKRGKMLNVCQAFL